MKLLALLLLLGCAPLSTIGTHRDGVQVCSRTNIMPYIVQVYLQDERGHTQWMGFTRERETLCANWPLAGNRGRWGYADQSTDDQVLWDAHWFDIWSLNHGYRP